jgi:CubicO group peptidase (beta-lactamase class C family)
MTPPNPDLAVNAQGLAGWNTPERRRAGFRYLHMIQRRGLSFRASMVNELANSPDPHLATTPGLDDLMRNPAFSALAVVRGGHILIERYAPDFGPDGLHSIQSITKTFVHLALGRLIAAGRADPSQRIGHYVPEAGAAYAGASLQDALDMAIASNFTDDYQAPYSPPPAKGAPTGYARQEIAMGWRLPPPGETEFGVRDFAAGLVTAPRNAADGDTLYASPNTDMLGWVIERASGRTLAEHVGDIIEAAGIAGSFHISADCHWVPVLSGGGVMTARDLARYGLLLGRHSAFVADAMSGAGTRYGGAPDLRYRNHLLSNGTWIGHPGYAGQFLMIDPAKQAAAAFFSVLETPFGDQEGYFAQVIAVLARLMAALR